MTSSSIFLLYLRRILLSFLLISCLFPIFGCSSEPVVLRTVEIATPPQIILGMDRNRFISKFPTANLEALIVQAWDYRVTFYGDDVYAAKNTGQGLSFADADRVVPQLLAKQPANTPLWLWFPVNDHSLDKLVPTYNHWKTKGWFNQATWFFFFPGISDEVRTVTEINYNNTIRTQYKALYPEIKWAVTRERSQFDPLIPVPLGDIYFPMFHMFEIEKAYAPMIGTTIQAVYSGVTLGGYVSGNVTDPPSMEPGWYTTNWKKYFPGTAPNVPVLSTQEASGILNYCKAQNMKFFLFWDANQLFDNVSGQPSGNTYLHLLLGF